MIFGGVTDRRKESDAYEPIVHKHRCAQKWSNLTMMGAHLLFLKQNAHNQNHLFVSPLWILLPRI